MEILLHQIRTVYKANFMDLVEYYSFCPNFLLVYQSKNRMNSNCSLISFRSSEIQQERRRKAS